MNAASPGTLAVAWVWQATLVAAILLAASAFVGHRARRILLAGAIARFLLPPLPFLPISVFSAVGVAVPPGVAPADWTPLLVVWAGGAVVTAAGVALRRRRLELERAAALPVTAGPLHAAARTAADRVGLHGHVDVRLTAPRTAPRAFGIVRRSVLLPADVATTLGQDALGVVLAHELEHHRRRDPLLLEAAEWARALWWFHPLAWIAVGRLRATVEEACDEAVLDRRDVSPIDYCDVILAVARLCAGPTPRAVPGFAAHPLGHRLRRIARGGGRGGGRLAVLLSLALVLVLLPCSHLRGTDDVVVRTVVRSVRVDVAPAQIRRVP